MSEELISYISHRLKMISVTVVIVSLTGLIYFSRAQSPMREFFGTSVGVFECFFFFLFFSVLLLVLAIDHELQKDKKKHEEFYKFTDRVNEYRESLRNCPEGVSGFQVLRDKLITFEVIILGRFDINCPETPMYFRASGWEECKEKWRIFLDNLYLCSEGRDLEAARKLSKNPVDIFPKKTQKAKSL